jgi:3-dehydroquinate dehydratase-2
MRILIINGPNLNLLGKREPDIYGNNSFEEFLTSLKAKYPTVQLHYFQSNVEGELINCLHENGFSSVKNACDAIVFNPGGYAHTSVAIADAIASIETPVFEVHISNVYSREEFRKNMITAAKTKGIITGFGLHSYVLAIDYILNYLK